MSRKPRFTPTIGSFEPELRAEPIAEVKLTKDDCQQLTLPKPEIQYVFKREDVRCTYCNSYHTRQRSTRENVQHRICLNCGKSFKQVGIEVKL
jgi:hypothetical protein